MALTTAGVLSWLQSIHRQLKETHKIASAQLAEQRATNALLRQLAGAKQVEPPLVSRVPRSMAEVKCGDEVRVVSGLYRGAQGVVIDRGHQGVTIGAPLSPQIRAVSYGNFEVIKEAS